MELTQKQITNMRHLAENDLFFLARGILGFDQVTPEFHGPLCVWLSDGHKRKLPCWPRGFFKTTLGSKCLPIQKSLRDPGISQLICCQIVTNASSILNDIRGIWESNVMLHALYPELVPTGREGDWNSTKALLNRPKDIFHQQEATYEAAGIGTQLQSKHFDRLTADDLVVAKKDQITGMWMQPSEEDIQKAIGWHQMSWGIMRNVGKSEYVQTMTRWCPDDMYDYLTKEEPGIWDVMLKSAELPDGTAAFPEKYPLEVLEQIRISQGGYKYATQYLCNPIAGEHVLFRETYSLYTLGEEPKTFKRKYASCDPAIGKKRANHPTAIIIAGQTSEGDNYVLDYVNARMTPSETVDALIRLWKRWRFKRLILETVAYQLALKYALEERFRQEGGNLFRIVKSNPGGNERKTMRIEGLHPSFTAGWWKIRVDHKELRLQLDSYPYGTFIDLLDALAMVHTLLAPHKGKKKEESKHDQINRAVATYDDIMKRLNVRTGKGGIKFDLQNPLETMPVR